MNARNWTVCLCVLRNGLKKNICSFRPWNQSYLCVCLYGRRRCWKWCHLLYPQDHDVCSEKAHIYHSYNSPLTQWNTLPDDKLGRTHEHHAHLPFTNNREVHSETCTHTHTHKHKYKHLMLNSVPFVYWKCFEAVWSSKTFHEVCSWLEFNMCS